MNIHVCTEEYSSVCRVPYGTRNGGLPIPMWGEESRFVDHDAHISRALVSLNFSSLL
jgi:hypothetical protein